METTSPTCSLSAIRESEAQSKCFTALQHTRSPTVDGSHRIVVFPALSNPNTKILASFSPKRASNFDIHSPMPSCREPQITCALSQSDRCLAFTSLQERSINKEIHLCTHDGRWRSCEKQPSIHDHTSSFPNGPKWEFQSLSIQKYVSVALVCRDW